MPSALSSVVPFSAIELRKSLASVTCLPEDIEKNRRVGYLCAYLEAINAATMVVETDYVDADYLDDYSQYYAKSFEDIPKHCKRIHFFSASFDEQRLAEIVLGQVESVALTGTYLGFVVARPLFSAVIGRTVLAHYPSDDGRRNYRATQTYSANLFGLRLQVESFAYQEQDTSLAACATVALWSCFHQTRHLFRSSAPTPVAITRAANLVLEGSRPFPSRGLQLRQICNAIASVGLDPEVYKVSPELPLATLMYAYLSLGLSILLLVEIPGEGHHALVVNGFSLRKSKQLNSEGAGVNALHAPFIGLRIDEFYAHDDQIGPFSRLKILEPTEGFPTIRFNESSWNQPMIPTAVVIPVHHKIRIGFREVLKYLPSLSIVGSWVAPTELPSFEWDVKLLNSNDFKEDVRAPNSSVPIESRSALLLEGQPKHVWRCTLRGLNGALLEALLDPTAMVNGYTIHRIWWCDSVAHENAKSLFKNENIHDAMRSTLGVRLFESVVAGTF